ncbi:hypothetical protein ACI782_22650 [Geodermatophilus sp. SYSU D00703]
MLDVRRTDLHSRFFHVFQYRFASELLEDLEQLQLDHFSFGRSLDAQRSHYGGWHYWLLYLKGYTQYQALGTVDADNVYLRHLARGLTAQSVDPTLRSSSAPAVTEMILRRFRDCDRLSRPATARQFAANELAPVTAFVRTPPSVEDMLTLYSVDSPEPTRARLVDGHHRLFAARLFGVKRLRFRVVMEPATVPAVPGETRVLELADNKLRIHGWLSPRSAAVQVVELRCDGRTIGRAPVEVLASAGLDSEGPRHYEFSIDVDNPIVDGITSVDVMALSDWLPVGRLPVRLKPPGERQD